MQSINNDFIIVGASISGLVTALTLEKIGAKYKIYEKEGEDRDGGAGVDMEKTIITYLEYLGIETDKLIHVTARKYFNTNDELIYENKNIRHAVSWKVFYHELIKKISKDKIYFNHCVKDISTYRNEDGKEKVKV